jgi:hypothetical protein
MRSLIIICAITFIISADIKKACTFLRKNAHKKSVGFAGKYVADALQYGGFKFTRQSSSYQYHKNGILRKMGFREIPKGKPKTGDIYVQDNNKTHKHGHIAMYCGNQWVSDFFQKNDQVFKTDPGAIHYYRFG